MRIKNYLTVLFVFLSSFIFNFIWENIHSGLYISNNIGINSHFLLMIYASFIDAFIIISTFLLLSLMNKRIDWKFDKKNLTLFCLILFIASTSMEFRAVLIHRWVYSKTMPTIFGLGISPLIQLIVAGLSVLFFLKILKFRYLEGVNKK